MLARQAAHLDALSNGRMILGVGAGWQVREHEMFGYPLLDKKARMERFAEGLQVIWLLLKSDAPVTFEGRWYSLRQAEILPRPFKTKILVGGNGVRQTLRLTARYADVWNGVQTSPAKFRELSNILDGYLFDAGREANAVKRTAANFIFFGRDLAALERRIARLRDHPDLRSKSTQEILDVLHRENSALTGMTDQVIPQIRAFAEQGVQELILQIFGGDDLEELDLFAREVLPAFA